MIKEAVFLEKARLAKAQSALLRLSKIVEGNESGEELYATLFEAHEQANKRLAEMIQDAKNLPKEAPPLAFLAASIPLPTSVMVTKAQAALPSFLGEIVEFTPEVQKALCTILADYLLCPQAEEKIVERIVETKPPPPSTIWTVGKYALATTIGAGLGFLGKTLLSKSSSPKGEESSRLLGDGGGDGSDDGSDDDDGLDALLASIEEEE